MSPVVLFIAGILVALLIISLYGNVRPHPPSRVLEIDGQLFPEGFLWSTGEDAYQHEGGNLNNNWARWEREDPSPIENGDVCNQAADFYNRYKEDMDLARGDFQNAHRIGIEWSRVEPAPGSYNEEAWNHYGDMLRYMREKGFSTLLNLWHFTLPLWAADAGGWDSELVMERWKAFVMECARRFSDHVDYWSTQIDSQIYALNGNALGEIPPCKSDQALAMKIYRNLIVAHAEAWHILHGHGYRLELGKKMEPRVGIIYFFFHFEPKSLFLDRFVTSQLDNLFNWQFLDACHSGDIDVGAFPGPRVIEYNERVKGTLDWIGVNYYTRQVISFNPFKPGFMELANYPNYPKSDMDWEIYPEGLYHLCHKLASRYRDIPLIITESGLADADDSRRPRFILDHLAITQECIEEGIPILGFTYWSLTDNWEWKEGFWPKFGLYEVDRNTMERRPRKKSVEVFRFVARHNRLPRKDEVEKLLS